jgi:hypothetical protein
MRQIDSPETPVTNYQSTLGNIPEEWRSHLNRGGSLKSRKFITVVTFIFLESAWLGLALKPNVAVL